MTARMISQEENEEALTPEQLQFRRDWAEFRTARQLARKTLLQKRAEKYCLRCGFKKRDDEENPHTFCCYTTFKPRMIHPTGEEPGLGKRGTVIPSSGLRLPGEPYVTIVIGGPTYSDIFAEMASQMVQSLQEAAANFAALQQALGSRQSVIDDLPFGFRPKPERVIAAWEELKREHPEWFQPSPAPPVPCPKPSILQPLARNRQERRETKRRGITMTAAEHDEARRERFGTLPVRCGAWEPGMRYRATKSGQERIHSLGKQKNGAWRRK